MKTVLVTGGCGFIGSEVTRQLVKKGYTVRVADNLSKPESVVKEGYAFFNYDLTDKQKALEVFEGVDICINLAAKIGGIGYFHKYPAVILSENNKIYSATFEAAVHHKISRMVYVSSSMVFESATQFPSKEEDAWHIPPPISAYGFSKLIGEQYCKAFYDEHKLAYSICRPFNAYGVNEYPGEEVGYAHVIPDIVKKILTNQFPLELLGDGKQVRCFTHVRDIAEGIITVMESEKAVNEAFNVSTSESLAIIDLAKRIWKEIKGDAPLDISFVEGFKHDIKKRIPDTTKMKQLLSWEAKTSLDDGLKEVIDWLRKEVNDGS